MSRPKFYFSKHRTRRIGGAVMMVMAKENGIAAEQVQGFGISRVRIGKDYFVRGKGFTKDIYGVCSNYEATVGEDFIKLLIDKGRSQKQVVRSQKQVETRKRREIGCRV